METNDIIKYHRQRLKLTQEELGEKLGVKRAAVQKWESGLTENIKRSTLDKLAKIFDISAAELLGCMDVNINRKIPILGSVAAGVPIEQIEDIKGYIEIPSWMAKRGKYFALEIKGKSMEPHMTTGDVVIVREQKTVENDEIAIAVVNGEEATVKQIKFDEKGIMLLPFNREFTPMYFTAEEAENKPVTIIGKVVELRRSYEF